MGYTSPRARADIQKGSAGHMIHINKCKLSGTYIDHEDLKQPIQQWCRRLSAAVGFDCATPQFVQFVLSLNLAYAENSPQANSGIKVGATNTPTKTARQRSLSKLLERGGGARVPTCVSGNAEWGPIVGGDVTVTGYVV